MPECPPNVYDCSHLAHMPRSLHFRAEYSLVYFSTVGKATPMEVGALFGNSTGSMCTGGDLVSTFEKMKASEYRYTFDTP